VRCSLAEALRGKALIEFPTLHVALPAERPAVDGEVAGGEVAGGEVADERFPLLTTTA